LFGFGVNDKENPESWLAARSASEIFVHPLYSSKTNENDITLFKLRV
jgi:hypothetical protein